MDKYQNHFLGVPTYSTLVSVSYSVFPEMTTRCFRANAGSAALDGSSLRLLVPVKQK